MKNWKTTIAGIAAIVTAIAAAVYAWATGEAVNMEITVAAVIAGVGLLAARDSDVTSEECGATKAAAARRAKVSHLPFFAVAAATLFLVGCGITDPIKSTTLTADQALTTADAGPSARVPTVDGESITLSTLAGLDVYNVDDAGIYGGSSQPKTITVLPLGDRNMFSASPSDTRIGRIQIDMVDGVPTSVLIQDYEARVSDPITALNAQVIAVLEATKDLSADERIRKIEQMRIAGEITAEVAKAAISAIITGLTGMP